jgi:hypothetical protein
MKSRAASERRAGHLRSAAASYREADSRRQPTAGDRFAMVVAGARHRSRPDAGAALQLEVMARLDRMALGARAVTVVGQLGGLDVELNATRDPGGAYGELGFAGLPAWVVNFTRAELRDMPPGGLVSRLEHRLAGLGERAHDAEEEADTAEREAARAAARIGAPFDQMDRIAELRARLAEIDVALAPLEEPDPPAATTAENRTVSYQDLPEDMQVLIADLCGRVDDLDDSRLTFEVFAIDISAFPVVDVDDDPQDTRYLVDHLGVPVDCFPPVLVLGEYWLDGRHRVAAARAQGIETIDAIDLTSLVDDDKQLQELQGWNLGRLNDDTATTVDAGSSSPGTQPGGRQSGNALDPLPGDVNGGPTYHPQWPRRRPEHRGPDADIGL